MKDMFFQEIDYLELLTQLTKAITSVKTGKSFQTFQLPLSPHLLDLALARIKLLPSNSSNYLLHKHMLRDRSHILAERQESKQKKADVVNRLLFHQYNEYIFEQNYVFHL